MDSINNYLKIFDDFEIIEQDISARLLQNMNLFKLLHYVNNEPLSMPMDEELAEDIMTEFHEKFDNGVLQYLKNENCRLIWEPFDSEAVIIDSAFVRLYPIQYNAVDVYSGDIYIQCDIIVHQSISKTISGRRRNLIAKEIINSLNGLRIKSTIQPLAIIDRPMTLVQFKDNYWGYSLLFKTSIATKGGTCG